MSRDKNSHLRLAGQPAVAIDPVEFATFEDGQRIGTEKGRYMPQRTCSQIHGGYTGLGRAKKAGGMFMFAKRHHRFAAAAVTIAFGLAATAANAAGTFTLKSTTFRDGKIMPKKVANSQANGRGDPNCVGENVSPQFSWTNVPDGTESFVFLMSDPEGRGGALVSHWVAYGISATVTGFAEGEVSKPSDKYIGGKSSMGVENYSGPCTPPGTSPHHYTFVLVATDFAPNDLPPGKTRDEVIDKLAAPGQQPMHTKGVVGMVGLFVNPWHK
jgi:Raf kinase inhibitor-like YbhB/YbcL family protein